MKLFGIYKEREVHKDLYRENYGWETVYSRTCLFFDAHGFVYLGFASADCFKILNFIDSGFVPHRIQDELELRQLNFRSKYGSNYDVTIEIDKMEQGRIEGAYFVSKKHYNAVFDLYDVDYEIVVRNYRSLIQDAHLEDNNGIKQGNLIRQNTVVEVLETNAEKSLVKLPIQKILENTRKNEYGQVTSFDFEYIEGWIQNDSLRVMEEFVVPKKK